MIKMLQVAPTLIYLWWPSRFIACLHQKDVPEIGLKLDSPLWIFILIMYGLLSSEDLTAELQLKDQIFFFNQDFYRVNAGNVDIHDCDGSDTHGNMQHFPAERENPFKQTPTCYLMDI